MCCVMTLVQQLDVLCTDLGPAVDVLCDDLGPAVDVLCADLDPAGIWY